MEKIQVRGLEYCIGDIYLVEIQFLYKPTGKEKYTHRPCILIGVYDGIRPLFLPLTRSPKPLKNSKISDKNINHNPSYLNDNFTLLSSHNGRPMTMSKMKK